LPRSQTKSSPRRSTSGSRAKRVPAVGAGGFEKILSGKDPLPASLYLGGRDEAAKAEALDRIKERWKRDNPGVPPTVHRASEAGVARVMADAQGGSLFAPVVFVEVLNVEEWARSTRTIDAAADGVSRVPHGNVLVLVESGSDTERKNLTPLKAACTAYVSIASLSPEELASWGLEHLKRRGVKAELAALEAVLEASRLETTEVLNELDKLADWAGPEGRITRKDAVEILRPVHAGRLAALARAVGEGDGEEAVDQFLRSLESGEREGNILFQLQTLYTGAIRLKSGQWGWIRDRENSARLAKTRSEAELSAGLDLLYRIERAWKSGRGDVRTLLVRALVGLAGEGRAASTH
jgi:DNA polymerase III delta subunit